MFAKMSSTKILFSINMIDQNMIDQKVNRGNVRHAIKPSVP